jgi:hypothetical protein
MNDFLELLPVPAERDLPAGSVEQRKAALLQMVEADLHSGARTGIRLARLRGLRIWLMSIGVSLALVATVGSMLTNDGGPQSTRVAVETAVVLGGGPAVASLFAMPRLRADGSGGGIGSSRAVVRILLPASQ